MWGDGIEACCHGIEVPRGSLTAECDTLGAILAADPQLSTGAELSTENTIFLY